MLQDCFCDKYVLGNGHKTGLPGTINGICVPAESKVLPDSCQLFELSWIKTGKSITWLNSLYSFLFFFSTLDCLPYFYALDFHQQILSENKIGLCPKIVLCFVFLLFCVIFKSFGGIRELLIKYTKYPLS